MGEFVKACKKSEIPDGAGKRVQVNGKEIAFFKTQEGVCAIYSVCPHQGGPLEEGGITDQVVTCPWHGWEFNVTTGECTFNDSIKQPTFRVKEEGEDVFVEA